MKIIQEDYLFNHKFFRYKPTSDVSYQTKKSNALTSREQFPRTLICNAMVPTSYDPTHYKPILSMRIQVPQFTIES